MVSRELDGRTTLVTGGSRGIGRATCVRLARGGARVAINYTSNEVAAVEALRLVGAEGAQGQIVQADVSDPEAVARSVAEMERGLGPVDLLVTGVDLEG